MSAQEGKEGVACRVGSSTFLRHCDVVGVVIISSSSPFSSSFWGPSVSLHALVVSVALPRSSGTTSSRWRVLLSSRPLPRVPSFRSARLNTFLRRYPPCFDPSSYPSPFVRSHGFRGREISPSTIAHACTLVPSFSLPSSSSSDR